VSPSADWKQLFIGIDNGLYLNHLTIERHLLDEKPNQFLTAGKGKCILT
jgi:hypothetical protein